MQARLATPKPVGPSDLIMVGWIPMKLGFLK
jgi:hypothetical protein